MPPLIPCWVNFRWPPWIFSTGCKQFYALYHFCLTLTFTTLLFILAWVSDVLALWRDAMKLEQHSKVHSMMTCLLQAPGHTKDVSRMRSILLQVLKNLKLSFSFCIYQTIFLFSSSRAPLPQESEKQIIAFYLEEWAFTTSALYGLQLTTTCKVQWINWISVDH